MKKLLLVLFCIAFFNCSKKELIPETSTPEIIVISKPQESKINITNGVDTLMGGYLGPVYLLNTNAIPIASINSLIFSAATQYGNGKVMTIGHDGLLVDNNIKKYDNLKFFVNSMKWLNSDKKKILIKNGAANFSNMSILIKELESNGYTIYSTNKIIDSDLKDIGIVLFGNDWNDGLSYSDSEVNTIKYFVQNGGGVLLLVLVGVILHMLKKVLMIIL